MFDKIKGWLKRRTTPAAKPHLVSTAPRPRPAARSSVDGLFPAPNLQTPVPKTKRFSQGVKLFNPTTGLSRKMITAHGPESAMLDDHLVTLKLERKAYELDLFTDRSL